VGREGVAVVDQSAIRGSRRSTPATYTGMLDDIRKLFARRNRDAGATAPMFSPNSAGACPTCHGQGVVYTDLAMMAGVSTPCEDCGGRRFRPEVLRYTVAGRDISEVLDMTVLEAWEFFGGDSPDAPSKPVAAALSLLRQVGLDYLRLGQPLTTLSGGERQRLKLASRIDGDAPVIVLDEPTTGLHLADTATLVAMMQKLVDAGHTLVVVEHNLAVIAAADHIIDMGPGAGHDGGRVVFEGTPAELVAGESGASAASASSLTGRYLAAAVQ
jgi:excinuclease UvrABC ATPase subunit